MAESAGAVKSDDINADMKMNQIFGITPTCRNRRADRPQRRARPNALCEREQRYLLRVIDEDLDLTDHMKDAVQNPKAVVAADQSIHTGQVVTL